MNHKMNLPHTEDEQLFSLYGNNKVVKICIDKISYWKKSCSILLFQPLEKIRISNSSIFKDFQVIR